MFEGLNVENVHFGALAQLNLPPLQPFILRSQFIMYSKSM